jgi:hypothetical protein
MRTRTLRWFILLAVILGQPGCGDSYHELPVGFVNLTRHTSAAYLTARWSSAQHAIATQVDLNPIGRLHGEPAHYMPGDKRPITSRRDRSKFRLFPMSRRNNFWPALVCCGPIPPASFCVHNPATSPTILLTLFSRNGTLPMPLHGSPLPIRNLLRKFWNTNSKARSFIGLAMTSASADNLRQAKC